MQEDSDSDGAPVFVTAGDAGYSMPPKTKFKGGKGKVAVDGQRLVSQAEMELNPQHGKNLKKELKKRRKQAEKAAVVEHNDDGDDAMGDDSYDFAKFQPIPGNAWDSDSDQE
jgi:hypothetical protein